MEEKEILEKICQKMGAGIPNDWKDSSIAIYSMPIYKGIYNKSLLSLRGFLTHPDTAKAIWGEETCCPVCGSDEVDDSEVMHTSCAECGDITGEEIYPWRYHNAIMVNMESVSEILIYMKEYL